MNKQAILDQIVKELESNRELLVRSATAAHEEATHEESSAENKYDTRGLEASYLAGAQSKRIVALDQTIRLFESMTPRDFGEDDPISIGAVIELAEEDGDAQWFFLAARAGGVKIEIDSVSLSILTHQSPLGRQLMNSFVGDFVELRIRNKVIEYEILSVT